MLQIRRTFVIDCEVRMGVCVRTLEVRLERRKSGVRGSLGGDHETGVGRGFVRSEAFTVFGGRV